MKSRFTSALLLAVAVALCAPAGASVVYSNGPFNGTINTYPVCCGSQVTESFTVSAATTITSFDAALWVGDGDTPVQINWAFGTAPYFTDIATNVVSLSNSCLACVANAPYWAYTSTASGLSVDLGPGTYWFTLGFASTADSGAVWWDENNGPSIAYSSWAGTSPVGSEAFTLYGGGSATPEPSTFLLATGALVGLAGRLRRGV